MTESFAKLTPPRVHDIYHRARLFDRLDQLRDSARAIWVAAPAGSGKTTLVASYLQARKLKPIWYQVDDGDSEFSSFIYYLSQALNQTVTRKTKLPLFTPEYHQGSLAFAREFFRQLFASMKKKDVLVFDNVQDVGEGAELYDLLLTICQEIPSQGQVIFISRTQFPENLARLEMARDLVLLDWSEVRLTKSEARELVMESPGLEHHVSDEHFEAIYDITDGWITGILLYLKQFSVHEVNLEAISEQGEMYDFENYHESLFNYFVNELFIDLSSQEQHFLLKVAWLPKMSSYAAKSLSDDAEAKNYLVRLEKHNYFISRKGSFTYSYELHPLFRKFLIQKSEEHFSDEQLIDIKRRTANILVKENDFEPAARLYLALEDWQALRDIILTRAETLEKQGRHQLLSVWLDALPSHIINDDRYLCYWQAIAYMYVDCFDAYEQFKAAYTLFEKADDIKGSYRCWLGMAECLFMRNDSMGDVPDLIGKLDLLRNSHIGYPSLEVRGRITIMAFSMLFMAQPNHAQFAYWLKETEKLYRFVPVAEVKCIAGCYLNFYYSVYGMPDKLQEVSNKLEKYIDSDKIRPLSRVFAIVVTIISGWLNGEITKTDQAIQKALGIERQYGVSLIRDWVLGQAAFSSLANCQFESATRYLKLLEESVSPETGFHYTHYLYSMAWLYAEKREYSRAKDFLAEGSSVAKRLHLPFLEGIFAASYGNILTYQNEYLQAKQFIEISRMKFTEIRSDFLEKFFLGFIEFWLEYSQGNEEAAINIAKSCLEYARQHNTYTVGWFLRDIKSHLLVFALEHNIEVEFVKRLIYVHHLNPDMLPSVPLNWPFPVKITTLGNFTIALNDNPFVIGKKTPKKCLDFIKAIIALGGTDIGVKQLLENLWPDLDGDAAYNAFKMTLHRTRKLIGNEAILYSESRVSLNKSECWVDVWCLQEILDALKSPLLTDANDLYEKLQTLLNVYKGPFLDREEEYGWILVMQERLHHAMVKVIDSTSSRLMESGQVVQALEIYHRAIELDEAHEAFYQGVMRCCYELGRPAEGISAYQRCRRILSSRFHVPPATQTEVLRNLLQSAQKLA